MSVARRRADVTLRERSDGEVYVHVLTREPLGVYELPLPGFRHEPAAYLQNAANVYAVRESGSGLWLPEVKVSNPFWHYSRWLDVSAGSDERRLFEQLATQERFLVVWDNEGVEVSVELPESTRGAFREGLEGSQSLDAPTWHELVEEIEWSWSNSWAPGRPRPRTGGARADALPPEGSPRVGGITLPAGYRGPYDGFWCTDEPMELSEALNLAAPLAEAFASTGLWPLLWSYPSDPEDYIGGYGEFDPVDQVDVAAALAEWWERHPPQASWVEPLGTHFPGLADATAVNGGPPRASFAALAEHHRASRDPVVAPRLMLVPCKRPADAFTVMGYSPGELEHDRPTAVLRSWEERFGAVFVEASAGYVSLSVSAPPQTVEHALRIAAEHYAMAPQQDAGRPGALRELAESLVNEHVWEIGWP